jgi:cysteinyl-tRNA synthetase
VLADRAGAAAAPLSPEGRELHERFVAAIDDDLDLPTAVATIHAILRADLPADERRWLVLDADAVLGLDLDRAWEPRPSAESVAPRTQALLDARVRARAAHDWSEADRIRDELRDLGVEPVDLPDGTSVLRPRNRG